MVFVRWEVSGHVGVHRRTSFMSSSLLLQQFPACLVCLGCFSVKTLSGFTLAHRSVGFYWRMSFMSSSLLLQQFPACLVCLGCFSVKTLSGFTLAHRSVGFYWRMSFMSSSLLLQQFPACLVCLGCFSVKTLSGFTLAHRSVGFYWRMSFMSSSLLLQQFPACLVCLGCFSVKTLSGFTPLISWDVASSICLILLLTFIVQFLSSFFSRRLFSVHVVHPCSSIDTTFALKKSRFIQLHRSDFCMIDSLLIAVHAFNRRTLTSLSVDEKLLLNNVNHHLD